MDLRNVHLVYTISPQKSRYLFPSAQVSESVVLRSWKGSCVSVQLSLLRCAKKKSAYLFVFFAHFHTITCVCCVYFYYHFFSLLDWQCIFALALLFLSRSIKSIINIHLNLKACALHTLLSCSFCCCYLAM